ncbi:hypothetical protein MLD38_004238 [Melastoma candidum]|uniref:Uncharacterized protein n=1 Tax=Melastoma candidum TaxID=119954 RepID=A0ACB9S577_9MYRT|nr:hypothetical protein MLD38_004238 [Melastoma candidum]
MTPSSALFAVSFFLFLSSGALSSRTVYELLPKYGLPPGLLPSSVVSYNLSSSDDEGLFVVRLSGPCYIQFDYLVYYDEEITGKLRYGSITELKGIQVQRFFFWLDVDEIRVDLPPADCIYFQVGLINKKLDVDQFRTVHSCREKGALQLHTPLEDMEMLLSE